MGRFFAREFRLTLATPVALALILASSLPGVPAAQAIVDPDVAAGEYGIVRVTAGDEAAVAGFARQAGAEDVQALDALHLVTARVSSDALGALSRHLSVRWIAADAPVFALGGGSGKRKNLNGKDTKLSPGVAAIEAPQAWRMATGRGVTVALMDSGIAAHPDLGGRVVARVDFVGEREFEDADKGDPGGHGTHLAGIIAGQSADGTFSGVAPDASLVSLRVLDKVGQGTLRAVMAAFDWLLKNRLAYRVRVLNISFGTDQKVSYHQDPLAAAAESAWFAGIVVVVAAGNDGKVATPGADPFVVTVGSFDDQGTLSFSDDRESSFSAQGPTLDGFTKPDLLAPGRRVVSLCSTGSTLDDPDHKVSKLYCKMSGTSVATAFVSGTAALVLERHSNYTPTQVKSVLAADTRDIEGSSTRVVDAYKAVKERPSSTTNAALKPSKLLIDTLNTQLGAANTTWENITWENITWENVSWENVTWENVSWENITWENISWDALTWETRVSWAQ